MNIARNPTRWLVSMSFLLIAGMFLANPATAGFYSVEEAHPILIKVDTNRDGYLSRYELRAEDAQMLCGFDEADIDHDGRLDLGEFEILLINL